MARSGEGSHTAQGCSKKRRRAIAGSGDIRMDSLAHLDEEIRRTKPNAGAKRGLHHANLCIARSRLLWHDHGNVVDIGAQAAANAPRSSAPCNEHDDLHKRERRRSETVQLELVALARTNVAEFQVLREL